MKTGRLEAFSDGVLAIIITIMVLEMKVPEGPEFETLLPVLPVFLTYLGSFVYIGIYWNNHHHLMQAVSKVNGNVLWANLHLLFWLSLFPFVTGWMGENHFEKNPVALYGIVLMMAAIAYRILVWKVMKYEGSNSKLKKAFGKDLKGLISILFYALGVIISFWIPIISLMLYIVVAIIWIVPDKRIEKIISEEL
ncbi:TMEM175 family protein [Robertkochia solimangrovi]|uniref:TMEM175 family protein n=1 Tax=Robertkochia solimangrovi TaxID=2213046 RepID=UPI0011806F4E|nr:TMEM175 family protein [Robertkochia solimangrovi]TRZ41873.1 hypothetical protein DMZ48_16140 [Robertkochia solimangrovi]